MVREATKDDCVKLAALSIKVWLDTYAREGIKTEYAEYVLSTFTATYFLEILDTIKYRVFVSEEQEVIQGYVMVNLESHYQTSSNGFEVEKLYVDNTFKGKGLGRKLLNEVENQFGNKYWLYTWVENESNGFYELICTINTGRYVKRLSIPLVIYKIANLGEAVAHFCPFMYMESTYLQSDFGNKS
ncbi:GNAT family N-acetyltransferase [Vibrio splendidus]|nr:GNAT family N-acetyltransferase [Vibrio splendidus]